MPGWRLDIGDIPRKNSFPFRVESIYYCKDKLIPQSKRRWDRFEVCLRLSSESGSTEDIVDGKCLKLPCPNVVWRLPGSAWEMPRGAVRDVISFSCSPDVLKIMETLGMKIDRAGWHFVMTEELEVLISRLRSALRELHTPGATDAVDWLCFSLMGHLLFRENTPAAEPTEEDRIRNISIWFRMHFAENVSIDEVAAANGMSRAAFFKAWKKNFSVTPSQYIIGLRLEAAARSLCETNVSVADIVREVHFAGEYMFYRRFRQKYGMTPGEYRRRYGS
ncbi:MAG: helix-turn-helix transcriptional regulator [Lentisphaeria bacterium]|nr:helix-turn-helix transcriptional regulator [Lentisphaeria bacterium]